MSDTAIVDLTTPDTAEDARATILVLDFGAQYAQLIARRVREAHVYSEIVPYSITAAEISRRRPTGIILSGGPKSVHIADAPRLDPKIFECGVPILGICYGAQLIAQQLGGEVMDTGTGEYGRTSMSLVEDHLPPSALFPDRLFSFDVWMSHTSSIVAAPSQFRVVASTGVGTISALEDPIRKIYGVQFHPEVVHTRGGQEILEHFLYRICECAPSWNMQSVIGTAVASIRARVGTAKVICGLSGGVDSAVAAALVHRAIGDQLTCVFVDTGLLRAGEADQVEKTFRDQFAIDLVRVDAQDQFLALLEGVTDPESKRKIIGNHFIRVFESAATQVDDAPFLVQGTLYPDMIESGTPDAARIKSHHNVGGLPADMRFQLVEPLKWLFKDEVRVLGKQLGLPDEIVWRQPFPGPGLAVRIIGAVTKERLEILRAADSIVTGEIKRAGLDRQIWQSFAILPVIQSVGVMGDERTYGYPIAIRAVTSEDAMTADWARIPDEVLSRISSRITNEVPGVNRVVLDITSKPPATIEWE